MATLFSFSHHGPFFLNNFIQFKDNVKDCKLIDPSDDYILKWLVGKLGV
jgi:hypothetical protein